MYEKQNLLVNPKDDLCFLGIYINLKTMDKGSQGSDSTILSDTSSTSSTSSDEKKWRRRRCRIQ